MPSVLSILPTFLLSARFPDNLVSELPETADMGDTPAARFAGACAASKTVTTPTSTPLNSPAGLKVNTCI